MNPFFRQKTIEESVSFSGKGIHTGKEVTLSFKPAEEGTGIVFQRIDLPSKPFIPAKVSYVVETSRSTAIGIPSDTPESSQKWIKIQTVEHVLAAVAALEITNLIIELDNSEPPIGNGSSDLFIELLEKAKIKDQKGTVSPFIVKKPIFWSQGDIHVVAIPANEFRISYTLSYPHSPLLHAQFQSFVITAETFKKEIASCRTFALKEEVQKLIDLGLIKGGSLENAVVIDGDRVLCKNGLFFPDEMVRHKILDMVGDLSLLGMPIMGHIMAIRSGHASNVAFTKCLLEEHEKDQNSRIKECY